MYRRLKIAVVIPAYNEEKLIGQTIGGVPRYVDLIIPVNDASKDGTAALVKAIAAKNKRVRFVDLERNSGVGGAIMAGHDKALAEKADIIAVMAGDNQMDPDRLFELLDTIIDKNIAYAKGNRFRHAEELKTMPKVRLIGNIVVTFMNKLATGYWSVSDPLNGYTAIASKALRQIDKRRLMPRYDFEISMLLELSDKALAVRDVFIPARYGTEQSKISLFRDAWRAIRTMVKGFFRRIMIRNFLYNSSIAAFFYLASGAFFLVGVVLTFYAILSAIGEPSPTAGTVMLAVLPWVLGIQFLLQAITTDMHNEP
jgi:glycosyltransferase involved in cell wall biosynthesis